MVREHHTAVWRLVRRLGVVMGSVDDVVQKAFCVAARRIADIRPGQERAFLFGTAVRLAADERRLGVHREVVTERVPEPDEQPLDPEALLDRKRARAVLDGAIARMPVELRAVFVMFELDQMTKTEVAEVLSLPVGTAVSRLRRARELFRENVARQVAEPRRAPK
jgi:RNA polymerase sigma-70 factor, ECF subfamily